MMMIMMMMIIMMIVDGGDMKCEWSNLGDSKVQ